MEKKFFEMCRDNEGVLNGLHIVDASDAFEDNYRVYTSDGHCLTIRKDEICDPSEYEDCKDEYEGLNKDGNIYTYNDERFPEFKTCSLSEAIEIVHKAII